MQEKKRNMLGKKYRVHKRNEKIRKKIGKRIIKEWHRKNQII
jgi:hypothetical protein